MTERGSEFTANALPSGNEGCKLPGKEFFGFIFFLVHRTKPSTICKNLLTNWALNTTPTYPPSFYFLPPPPLFLLAAAMIRVTYRLILIPKHSNLYAARIPVVCAVA